MTGSQGNIQEEDALGKAFDAHLMRRLLRYLYPYRGRVALAVLILIGASALQVVGPWITKIALDEAIPAGDGSRLATLAAVYMAAIVGVFALQYAQVVLTAWLGQKVMYDLRTEIFRKLQLQDLRFYDRNPVGRLMTRITSDVETLNELFRSGVVTVFGDLFTLFFIFAAMLQMNWRLALLSFTVLPFVVLTAFLFRARIRIVYRDIRLALARINAFIHERITGVTVVQLFNREEADGARLAEINQLYLGAHLRSITYYALFFPIIELFTAITLALIIWRGGIEVMAGTLTVGIIAAFLQYARRFFRPIQDLSEKYNILQAAMASSERVFKLLDQEVMITDPAEPLTLPSEVRGEIEFRNVWFAYGKTEDGAWDWILKGVSFKVAPGEKVAIVGHTGAGKTTLINLLLRFYEPQKGEILLDGIAVDRVAIQDLRARLGLVLQDIFLFSQSVGYNIRLGSSDIPDDRLREAADRVGASRFIDRLPGGFEQALGERGSSLSVGERQLISFARALAFDPPILILDEATSSVDSEIEARIEEATHEVMAGRTSLVIAHRLSTVQGADRILVFHHGELKEEGSHRELLEVGGLYARLYELQFVALTAGV